MYTLVKESEIVLFLAKYGIDFLSLGAFEQAIIIVLSNIFFLLFWIFIISFSYKVICRVLRWF